MDATGVRPLSLAGSGPTAVATIARVLASLIEAGEAAPASDDPRVLSVLGSAGALGNPELAPQAAAAARERAVALLEELAPLLDVLVGHEIGFAPVHGLHHLGVLYESYGQRWLAGAALLVSPYDLARARLLLAARGFGPGEAPPAGAVRLIRGPLTIILYGGLHTPGWRPLPLSPFLESTVPFDGVPRFRLAPDSGWAAHRLLAARNLWPAGERDGVHLAELAALADGVGEEERTRWRGLARRWGIGRLWKRADEVEAWLRGGARPSWLGERPAGGEDGPAVREPALKTVVTLQDSVGAALAAPFRRWAARRRD